MRKIFFGALVALCLALPGRATAEVCQPIQPLVENPIPDQKICDVLLYAANHLGLNYQDLCSRYESGEITIEEKSDGYHVSLTNSTDGGTGLMVIADL